MTRVIIGALLSNIYTRIRMEYFLSATHVNNMINIGVPVDTVPDIV